MKLELEFTPTGELLRVRQDGKSIALADVQRLGLTDAIAMLDGMLITTAEANNYLPKAQRDRWRAVRLQMNNLFFAMFGKPVKGPERNGCREVRLVRESDADSGCTLPTE